MTQKIIDSIGIQNTRIFYDHFHLKLNLEKPQICRLNILLSIVHSMCISNNEVILNILFEKKNKHLYGHMNNYVSILVKFID